MSSVIIVMLTKFGQQLGLHSELAWQAHLSLPPTAMGATKVEGFTIMTITWSSLRRNGSRLAQEKALNELYKMLESGKQIWPAQPFCTFIQWRLFSRVWWPSLVANGQGMTKIWAVKARGLSHVMSRDVLGATCPGLAAYAGLQGRLGVGGSVATTCTNLLHHTW